MTPLWTTNAPTAVDAGPDAAGVEGSSIPLAASVLDLDGDTITMFWAVSTPLADGTGTFSDVAAAAAEITCDDNRAVAAMCRAAASAMIPAGAEVSNRV